jgi:hypothetical protein
MITNFCEEMKMPNSIADFHEKVMEGMEIPKWMNLDCPYCGKKLSLRSIRSFGVKLNTRNLGDIVLEIFCYECSKMDTVYFRSEVEKVSEFIGFLNGNRSPKNKPVLEVEMYKQKYNNVMEKMLSQGVNQNDDD